MERAACGWEVAARWRGPRVDGRWRRDGEGCVWMGGGGAMEMAAACGLGRVGGGGVWPGPCGWRRRVACGVWAAAVAHSSSPALPTPMPMPMFPTLSI